MYNQIFADNPLTLSGPEEETLAFQKPETVPYPSYPKHKSITMKSKHFNFTENEE